MPNENEDLKLQLLRRALPILYSYHDKLGDKTSPPRMQKRIKDLISEIENLGASVLPYYGSESHAKKVHFGEYPREIRFLKDRIDHLEEGLKFALANTQKMAERKEGFFTVGYENPIYTKLKSYLPENAE